MKKIFNISIIFISLLFFTNVVLAQEPHSLGGGNKGIQGSGGYQVENLLNITSFTKQLEKILSNVIGFLTILGGIWFFVQFMIGGLGWAGAGGDSKKVEDARHKMTNGAIGLIAMVAAYSIVYIIGKILGVDFLNIGEEIAKLAPEGQG